MKDNLKSSDVIRFVQGLKHTGDFFGKPFDLMKWQIEVLNDVYGTVDEDGRRQYKTAYLEIPKKNGKSETVAALALYHLLCDPPGGQIYCAAAERNQAALVFNAAKDMVDQSPYLGRMLRIRDSVKEMVNISTHTTMKVLSSESYSKHGLNPSVVIIDELHAHPKRDLFDTLTFGSGAARQEQLIWIITTAGDDPDRKSIGWEKHEYAEKVRDGELIDPTWYVKIYGVPDGADIYDESNWYKANPSLGVTINVAAVRKEALAAQNSEAAEKLFRWLRLNQWVALKRIGWLPITLWDKTQGEWSRADMLRRECYVGIDLSSTTDLTAITTLFPPQGNEGWRFFVDAWIPEDNMKERENRDHVPFSRWVKAGHIHATPGNVVDFGYLANHIEKLSMDYKVKYFCGDPWHLEVLRQMLKSEEQNKFIQIPQTMAGMSPAMHELEKLFMNGGISHEANPMGRWTFGNVIVATDGNENKKPMKNKSIDRIDPICALIDAMAAAIKLEPKKSVYEDRGLRVI